MVLIPGLEGMARSPGGGHGNSLWYSCLKNPMDREAWWAIVLGSQRVGHHWSDLAHKGQPLLIILTFSSVQSLSRVRLFATPWITACQASLSITNSWSTLRLTSIESVMPSSHLILCHPLLLLYPQSLPASESFPMSQLFAWDGQSTGVSASASFVPKKSQGWSPSEWTGWISLQSKGLSRVFSNTTVPPTQKPDYDFLFNKVFPRMLLHYFISNAFSLCSDKRQHI